MGLGFMKRGWWANPQNRFRLCEKWKGVERIKAVELQTEKGKENGLGGERRICSVGGKKEMVWLRGPRKTRPPPPKRRLKKFLVENERGSFEYWGKYFVKGDILHAIQIRYQLISPYNKLD